MQQQTSQREWERQAVQSLQRARARRRAQDEERNDRFWFWGLVAIAAIVVTIMLGAFAAKAVARQTDWSASVASVYDSSPQTASGRHATYMVAHKTLPFGTRVRFLYHGRKVTATVLDRGPYVGGREFDLNYAVQGKLGFPYGVGVVRWRVIR